MPVQPYAVSCEGGLDLTSSPFTLLKFPGRAKKLTNMEPALSGGYKKIYGYEKFGTSKLPNNLGSELITNGTFDTDVSGWTAVDATLGWLLGGLLRVFNTTTDGYAYQSFTTVVGESYIVEFDGAGIAAGATSGKVVASTTSDSTGELNSLSVLSWLVGNTFQFVATTTTTYVLVYTIGTVPAQSDWDNVSVKQINDITIVGITDYADGVFACAGTGIYFSTEGATWIQVNKDGASAGLTLANLKAASPLVRTTDYFYNIVTYEGSEEYGITIATNGIDEAAWIKFTGSGSGRTYFYKELDNATTGAPSAPVYAEILKERLFLSGDSTNPNRIYWSDRYEMDDFLGSGAGFVDIADEVTGIKAFREQLVIFGKNSIYTLSGFDGGLTLKPVTRNVGCINGFTIQEFGSNILFLARDGIRTVAATDRIGDLELGVVSRNITPLISDIVSAIGTYDISSIVIKKRNQYRLFYNSSATTSKGIVGTLRYTAEGATTWEWGELEDWDAPALVSTSGANEEEDIYHGAYDGYIYKENISGSFDGAAFKATYTTVEMDLGDISMRKTFHQIALSTDAEGTLSLTLSPEYDFADSTIHQPNEKTLDTLYSATLIGSFVLGTGVLGAAQTPITKINLEGSGYSAAFKFETNDINAPYTIGGFFVEFIPSGRR